ncbi:MAG: hypothetical protein FWH49_02490 [Clostridiales bacterium]|nr:hypothetical protein [Clostridiales bacterium]
MKNNDPIWTSPEMLKNPKSLALDQALGKLQEVGVADTFLTAVKNNPEFLKALRTAIPEFGIAPIATDWSCCITNQKGFDPTEIVSQPRPDAAQRIDNSKKTIG